MSKHFVDAVSIIRKKRDGEILVKEEIEAFIHGYTQGELPDYQASALLMAIFYHGLNSEELSCLTKSMMKSGSVFDLKFLQGSKIDKHSTGGVGDKVSLPLAPAVAACGVFVPMMSGRSLGHTGGTLDKLESIPGFRTQLSSLEFYNCLQKHGLSLIGQTQEIVPADKKLYALRDVTATVESMPLIAASIMSKKLAEGIDALVLDVKVGKGALMKKYEDARMLAQTMIAIGTMAGKKVSAYITDMNEPIGRYIGNAAEVNESLDVLLGEKIPEIYELTCALGAEMLLLAQIVNTLEEGKRRIDEVLQNGSALRKFADCATMQGASIQLLNPDERNSWRKKNVHLNHEEILASQTGYVGDLDAYLVGIAGVSLGIGRMQKEDSVDPAAYIYLNKKRGEKVEKGEVLCRYAAHPLLSVQRKKRARDLLESAYHVQGDIPSSKTLIYEVLR